MELYILKIWIWFNSFQEKKNFKKFTKAVSNKVDKVGEKAKKNLSKVNLNLIGKGSPDHDPSEERDHVSMTMPLPLPNKFSLREVEKEKKPIAK